MRRPRGFLGNWLALASSDMAGQALSLVAVPRVARGLEPEGYGLYTLALSTAALFGLLAGAGLPAVIVTEVAKRGGTARAVLRPVIGVRLVSVSVAAGLALAVNRLSGARLDPAMAGLTVTLIATAAVLDVLESIAFGRRIVRFSSSLSLVNAVLWVALLYLVPARFLDARAILTLYVTLQAVQTAAYALFLIRASSPPAEHEPVEPLNVRLLLGRGLPYLWVNLSGVVLVQGPVLLLAAGSGAVEVGYYSAGYRLALPLTLLLGALARAALPHLVISYRAEPEHFRRTVQQGLQLVTALGPPAAVLLTGIAADVVRIILGPVYANTARVLGFLAGAMICLAVLSVLGLAVGAMERQHRLALLSTAATVLALPLIVLGASISATALAGLVALAYLLNLTVHLLALAPGFGFSHKGISLLLPILSATAIAAMFPHDAAAAVRWPLAVALAAGLLALRARALRRLYRSLRQDSDKVEVWPG